MTIERCSLPSVAPLMVAGCRAKEGAIVGGCPSGRQVAEQTRRRTGSQTAGRQAQKRLGARALAALRKILPCPRRSRAWDAPRSFLACLSCSGAAQKARATMLRPDPFPQPRSPAHLGWVVWILTRAAVFPDAVEGAEGSRRANKSTVVIGHPTRGMFFQAKTVYSQPTASLQPTPPSNVRAACLKRAAQH
jgi:hypothetical protein